MPFITEISHRETLSLKREKFVKKGSSYIIVELKDELRHCMPFKNLPSRHSMAIVLSYLSNEEDVYELM